MNNSSDCREGFAANGAVPNPDGWTPLVDVAAFETTRLLVLRNEANAERDKDDTRRRVEPRGITIASSCSEAQPIRILVCLPSVWPMMPPFLA
jgi:hypothetical protein